MIVDLHSHVLPQIDDGPSNIEESLELLNQMLDQSVTKVISTPHFDPRKQDPQVFLSKREQAYNQVQDRVDKEGLDLELSVGAEIYFREEINHMDLRSFTLAESNYLLIELPTRTVPPGIERSFKNLLMQGYQPVLAHIERYAILRENLDLFTRLVDMGVIMQVNLSAYLEKDRFLERAFKKGYIQILASDAHDAVKRPAKWNQIDFEDPLLQKMNENALKIWNNDFLEGERKGSLKRFANLYI